MKIGLTSGGEVRGRERDGVVRFLGVPYAKARHRFAAPEPVTWTGVLDAGLPGVAPWQLPGSIPAGSEPGDDCLNVAIWAPREAQEAPVLLWIYGGGFEGGSNAIPCNDGARLAREGRCVVVSVNHRVGSFGFAQLSHHAGRLSAASNLGVQDVIAALQWTVQEIRGFGGNPGELTVMGSSSGSFIATALLAVPRVRPLLRRVILISGAASRLVPLPVARTIGDRLLHQLGLAGNPDAVVDLVPRAVLDGQRKVLPHDIGIRNGNPPGAFGVVDDMADPAGVLVWHPMDAVVASAARNVELLVCAARDEVEPWRRSDPRSFDPADGATLAAEVESWGIDPTRARAIADHYLVLGTPGEARSRLLTDWIYRMPSARLALAQCNAGGIARLALIGRANGEPAGHGSDRGLFGNTENSPAIAARDADMRASLLNFVGGHGTGWSPLDGSLSRAHCFAEGDAAAEFATALEVWDGIPRR